MQVSEGQCDGEAADDEEGGAKEGKQAGETVHGRRRKSRVGLLYKVLD